MPANGIPLVVLGMHRSGTSMLMRLCNLAGVHVGERLIAAREDNAKGFWEHAEIVELDEKIFRLFALNSQDVLPFPPDWLSHPELAPLKEALLAAVRRDLCGDRIWGLKDPRIGRLLPVWLELFATLEVQPRFVIPFRHPSEVARSLARRDYITIERGLLLWLEYNLEIERHTRGFPRVFVSFDRLFSDPADLLADIERRLPVELPIRPEAVREQIAAFVEPDLRHQRRAPQDDSTLPEAAARLHQALLALEQTGSADPAPLDRIRADLQALLAPCAETVYALHPPIGAWRQTIEAKEREIEALRTRLRRHEGGD